MPRSASRLLCLGLAALATVFLPAATLSAEEALTFQQLAPGIHAGLQPAEGRFDDCNVMVVVGSNAVLVVDAPAKKPAVEALAAGIRRLTDLPVRWVVNTHWHGDHTQGNAFLKKTFGTSLVVIGHESLVEDIPNRAAPQVMDRVKRMQEMVPQAEAQLARGLGLKGQEMDEAQQAQQRLAIDGAVAWLVDNADAEFLAPMLTYATGVSLHLDPFTVILRHRPGHTRGDTVIWIPQAKILASGDLMDDLPYIGHGFPRAWVESLEAVGQLPFTTVVPGHGPVFSGREQFDKVQDFLEALVARAEAVKTEGGTLESLQESPQMDAWRARFVSEEDARAGRFFDGVLGEALERAWRDVNDDLDMNTD
jgi:cyclase